MHAFSAAVGALELEVESEAVGSWVAELEAGFEQPAKSRLAAPSAATILNGWRK